tara:strand:+ start:3081 stop:3533 length:453 start_codon:yes stop_codon:yes gene_type:complete
MATTFKIQYAASATPIESTQLTDTNNVATSVHSSIDKSVGGGKEISCSTTAANVAYKDYTTTATTTTTFDTAVAGNIDAIDFLMVKIREAGGTGTPDVTIEIGGQIASKLIGIGDVCLLRPSGANGDAIEIFSSGSTTLAKVDILYGLES